MTPLELTGAYAAFANGGYRVSPYFITEVDDNARKVLYRRQTPAPQRVNRQLRQSRSGSDAVGRGDLRHRQCRVAQAARGRGQDRHHQNSQDAWFVGFTTDYVTAVWVGNDDNKPTRGITGGALPAQIWREAMRAAEEGKPLKPLDRSPPQPPNVTDELTASGRAGRPAG